MNPQPSSEFFGVCLLAVVIWVAIWTVLECVKDVREKRAQKRTTASSIRQAIERTEGLMRTRPMNGSVFKPSGSARPK